MSSMEQQFCVTSDIRDRETCHKLTQKVKSVTQSSGASWGEPGGAGGRGAFTCLFL